MKSGILYISQMFEIGIGLFLKGKAIYIYIVRYTRYLNERFDANNTKYVKIVL